MTEIPFEYINKLASQSMIIVSLLGGFSLSAIILLFEKKEESRLLKNIFNCVIIATLSFLVAIFANTKLLMMTTEGYPFKIASSELAAPRIIAGITILVGVFALIALLFIASWSKSKNSRVFTIIATSIAIILILWMIT